MDSKTKRGAFLAVVGIAAIMVLLGLWKLTKRGSVPTSHSIANVPPGVSASRDAAKEILQKPDANPHDLTNDDWNAVRAMCNDTDWRVRVTGLTVLPSFRQTAYENGAWRVALGGLSDESPAARAVVKLRQSEAARHIVALLEDPDRAVRKSVADLLLRLGYEVK